MQQPFWKLWCIWTAAVPAALAASAAARPRAKLVDVSPHVASVMRREERLFVTGATDSAKAPAKLHYDLKLPLDQALLSNALVQSGSDLSSVHTLLTGLGARDDVDFSMSLGDKLDALPEESGSGECTTQSSVAGQDGVQSAPDSVRICNMPKTRNSLMPGDYRCTGSLANVDSDVLSVLYSVCVQTGAMQFLLHLRLPGVLGEPISNETRRLLLEQTARLRRALPPQVQFVTTEPAMDLHAHLEVAGVSAVLPNLRLRYTVPKNSTAQPRWCECTSPGSKHDLYRRAFSCNDYTLNWLCPDSYVCAGSPALLPRSGIFPGCRKAATSSSADGRSLPAPPSRAVPAGARSEFGLSSTFQVAADEGLGGSSTARCFWYSGKVGSASRGRERWGASFVCALPGSVSPSPRVKAGTANGCSVFEFVCRGRPPYVDVKASTGGMWQVGNAEVQYATCSTDRASWGRARPNAAWNIKLSVTQHNFNYLDRSVDNVACIRAEAALQQ